MFERIWAMSDIHGSYLPIKNFWNRNKDNINFSKETDCIILLGDVGANYYLNYRDKDFKKKLEEFPFTYFCIRGNHEERASICVGIFPESWHTEVFFDNTVYVENDYPEIKYALDYPSIYNINNYKTLVIPGAYSVDKYYRFAHGWSWFEREQLSEDEMELGRTIIKQNPAFDLILSHTCPIVYEPTDLFLSVVDQSTVDKTMERYLGEIEYNTEYKLWLFGHFHSYRVYLRYKNSQIIMLSDGKEAINIQEWIENPENIHQKY